MLACRAHELLRRVETHRLAVQQRAAKRGRLVMLEPRRHVNQQRKARGMRLGETVFAEALDLLEEPLGELLVVAALRHAVDQPPLEALELAVAPPRRHRAAQLIRFTGREAGGDHRQLHHLFLEDRHAERALEHLAHRLARIGDRLFLRAPAQIRMHHVALDRPGTDDRDLDHEVVELLRLQPRQHRHLRARLDLEHADRVGAADHVVDACRPRPEPSRSCSRRPENFSIKSKQRRIAVEHAEAQHIDLEQAELVEIVLVPLDHGAVGHRGVFDGHELVERGPLRITKPPTCWDRWRGKPINVSTSSSQTANPRARGIEAGLGDTLLLDQRRRPTSAVHARLRRLGPRRIRAPCRRRESRCAAGR